MINHSKPTIDEADIQAVAEVLRSGHIAEGEVVKKFEAEFSRFIDVRHSLATNSGTSALHLALLALGLGEGDEVIVPSYVCTAVLNAISYTGAGARVADIKTDDFNLDVDDAKRKINQKTKAIALPHMFGAPADIDEVLGLGVPVIEDCAQSIGATYKGKRVGSFGALSIFSFYATKMMATGEGGMLLTNSDSLFERARDLRDFDERDNYILRYNYKMTDAQAALGLSQLARLPSFIERRCEIARAYSRMQTEGISSHIGTVGHIGLPVPKPDREMVFYRYVIKVEGAVEEYTGRLRKEGIEAKRPVYRPLHSYLGLDSRDFPGSEETWRRALSIPIYPSLSDDEVEFILKAVSGIFH